MAVLANAMIWVALLPSVAPAQAVDPAPFVRKDTFESIKISPTGEFYAAIVPTSDRTILTVLRRSDRKVTAQIGGLEHSTIASFAWVNDHRLVLGTADKFGSLDAPQLTGDLYAINADGSAKKLLLGPDRPPSGPEGFVESFEDKRAAFLEDSLPGDDQHVLVSVRPFGANPQTHIEKVDVYTGAHSLVATAPVRRANFAFDPAGVARFAEGAGNDNVDRLYYRDGAADPWRLINDEARSGHAESPVGFSADGRTAYLQVERETGPDALEAMDTASGQRRELLRDAVVDPYAIIHDGNGETPIGAYFMGERLTARFFDDNSPPARQYRQLQAAFPGEAVVVTSRTTDGRLSLVRVSSDRNPGDYYLFDAATLHADLVFHQQEWFQPEAMAGTREVTIPARDGLLLHAYLTSPPGVRDRAMPTVLFPHGGPIGEFDTWGFDRQVQLLARAGFAVMQVNYRGSGNYGRAFLHAGAGEWGRRMQDDLTDATHWLIEQKLADPQRICIFGASYGAYAALMGAVREPALYRCAVGYVGVYDLVAMAHDNARTAKWAQTWTDEWVGEKSTLAAISPVHLADRIKVPVLLVAGGRDDRAPIGQSKAMEKAIRAAGGSVESWYVPTEGHGFYTPEHQREFYTRLLAFLQASLGETASDRARRQ
jgi:dipeptidyl aminopeptidase/acylaminoacyl peptidase